LRFTQVSAKRVYHWAKPCFRRLNLIACTLPGTCKKRWWLLASSPARWQTFSNF